jgi:hypothetical protein
VDQKLKYALILAFVANCALAFSSFYDRTFDSYTHMFFADHYRRSWFDTWEPKWFGGFSVTSYPPLAHQIIALVSYILGLAGALQVLTLISTVVFPVAVYKFSRIFVSEEASGYASIISVFLPSVFLVTYNFGQFPTLLSLTATLFMAYYLTKYLENGAKFDFGLTICLLEVSITIHHFTALFFLPLIVIALLIMLVQKRIHFTVLAKRFLVFLTVGLVISLIVLYPFLSFSTSFNMQPIPHITRTSIFSNESTFAYLFLGMYGPALLLIPFAGLVAFRYKRLLPLLAVAILLLILGLGGTTILPRLLFGDFWQVLTYERFSLWAGVAFLPLFGLFFESQLKKGSKPKKYRKEILIIFMISMAVSAMYSANVSMAQPTNVNLEPLREFLGTNGNSNWRYITLGFGEAKFQELSIVTNASTLDGGYFVGRTIPILANSSIGTLDSAKFYGEHGMDVLGSVLNSASEYNIRWVFCNDPYYYSLLNKTGYVLKWSQDSTGDGRLHGVTIWEKEGIPQIDTASANYAKTHPISPSEYIWGIAPLSFLLATLILLTLARLKRNRARTIEIENSRVK